MIDNNLSHEIINGTDYISIDQEFGDCSKLSQSCAKISIFYPQLTQLPHEVQNTVDRYIKYSISDFLLPDKQINSDDVNQYIIESASQKAQETKTMNERFLLQVRINKIYESDHFLTLSHSWSIEENSSSPESGVSFMIVSLPSGEVLEQSDIIDNPNEIKSLILSSFKREQPMSQLNPDDIPITDNIGIEDKNLLLEYMPYELGDDFDKSLTVSIPKHIASPHLNKKIVSHWQ